MSQILFRSVLLVPAVLGTVLGATGLAETTGESSTLSQVNRYANEGVSMNQVRSVNQLSDVKPTDWAYQALRSLVERYGCIAGYPDGTFRGSRAMTRYEFAAGLNACLDTVNELIASATADLATQEDLLVLQRLQEEFQAELATLRGRVDALEARTSELESNQFSTTTKLGGEVLFSLQDEFGSPDGSTINTTFGGNVTLNLYSSFTGTDKLTTRLEAENITGSNSYGPGLITYSGGGLDFNLEYLGYTFSPSDKATIVVGPIGISSADFVPTTAWYGGSFFSDYFDAPAFYEQDADEIGIGGNYQFNDNFNLAAGFLSNSSNSLVGTGGGPVSAAVDNLDDGASPSEGVFIDNWAAMAQLSGTVGNFEGVLAFVHEYTDGDGSGLLGGFRFYDGIGTSATAPFVGSTDATAETVGLSMKYEFSPRFILQAFGTHSWADAKSGATADAKSYSAGLGFIFPDLFREGNEGGIAVGVPPHVYDGSGLGSTDNDTPIAIDLYYDFAISDNITITPGGILLFNGNGSSNNDTTFVGALKTKFKF